MAEIGHSRRLARLMLQVGGQGNWVREVSMRRFEAVVGAAIWIAVAILMPMSALEPVGSGVAQAASRAAAGSPCEDGSPRLAMGCLSVHL
jgi:hypothetical protein